MQPELNVEIVKMRGLWDCLECKECTICHSNNEEEKIIICDMCDRAMHIDCLNPPLPQVPQQSWFCDLCVKCLKCGTKMPPIKLKGESAWMGNAKGNN